MNAPNAVADKGAVTKKEYCVRVGLAECEVTCCSEREAVALARAELGRRLPQMWDIIQGMGDRHFCVIQIG
jgi:hypothetical protein